jgi:hypothetical protein
MPKKGTLTGTWSGGQNEIECTLSLIIFEEDNNHIFYCPALDLSGYGSTEAEASSSFNQVLSEYFSYTVNKGTLAKDLRRLGWTLRKSLRKKATPPELSKLLETNEDFSRIFNTHDFRKTQTVVNIPAMA